MQRLRPTDDPPKALRQLSADFEIDYDHLEACRAGTENFNDEKIGRIREMFDKKIQERREAKSNIMATVLTGIQAQVSCLLPIASSYAFKDASDGNADVGFAILTRCGTSQCSVGYGGTATRQNTKRSSNSGSGNTADIHTALQKAASSGIGTDSVDEDVVTSAEATADLMVPASK